MEEGRGLGLGLRRGLSRGGRGERRRTWRHGNHRSSPAPRALSSVRGRRSQGGIGLDWAQLGCHPPLFFLFPFFVEKRREEKKGKRGIKNYNNNFYELPFSKLFRFTSFGSEIFGISNYLNLKLNWHCGFN